MNFVVFAFFFIGTCAFAVNSNAAKEETQNQRRYLRTAREVENTIPIEVEIDKPLFNNDDDWFNEKKLRHYDYKRLNIDAEDDEAPNGWWGWNNPHNKPDDSRPRKPHYVFPPRPHDNNYDDYHDYERPHRGGEDFEKESLTNWRRWESAHNQLDRPHMSGYPPRPRSGDDSSYDTPSYPRPDIPKHRDGDRVANWQGWKNPTDKPHYPHKSGFPSRPNNDDDGDGEENGRWRNSKNPNDHNDDDDDEPTPVWNWKKTTPTNAPSHWTWQQKSSLPTASPQAQTIQPTFSPQARTMQPTSSPSKIPTNPTLPTMVAPLQP